MEHEAWCNKSEGKTKQVWKFGWEKQGYAGRVFAACAGDLLINAFMRHKHRH